MKSNVFCGVAIALAVVGIAQAFNLGVKTGDLFIASGILFIVQYFINYREKRTITKEKIEQLVNNKEKKP